MVRRADESADSDRTEADRFSKDGTETDRSSKDGTETDRSSKDRSENGHLIRDHCGVYHNDYSPRYQPAYNIYDKAREHMKKLKDHKYS